MQQISQNYFLKQVRFFRSIIEYFHFIYEYIKDIKGTYSTCAVLK